MIDKYVSKISQLTMSPLSVTHAYTNYPNPFNPKTKIGFDVGASTSLSNRNVRLVIYNSLGQIIETQSIASLQPGTYEYEFNGSNYPSGVYFYQLSAGDFRETRKMVLVK